MAQHFGGRWIARFALKLNVEYQNSNGVGGAELALLFILFMRACNFLYFSAKIRKVTKKLSPLLARLSRFGRVKVASKSKR